jgi:hypothetical protein
MEGTDNKQVKTKREMAMERLQGRYPEKDFSDEEVMFGQISDDYDDYDRQIGEYKDREDKLNKMFDSDPRTAYFLSTWREGNDPVVSLIRQFGTDIKDAIDDPARQDEIAAANKDFVERMAKEKELEAEYQSNLEESLKVLEQVQQEKGASDEDIDNAMEFLVGIMKDGIVGKFSRESIEMAMKALGHDADVAAAAHEGEVLGRNAQIEEKLRKKNEGDGTAMLDGKNGSVRRPNNRSIFDVARDAQ